MTARVLVAGIGNVFLGDDGFGVEVISRMQGMDLPPDVVVGDYGISGLHLAYDLLDHTYETTIFVDATTRGGVPGTVYLIDATSDETDGEAADSDAADGSPGNGGTAVGAGSSAVADGTPERGGTASGSGSVPGPGSAPVLDAHGMDPATVLTLLRGLGGSPGRVLVVGCEPQDVTEGMGLSAVVDAAVEEAVWRVLELVDIAVERGGADVSRHSR